MLESKASDAFEANVATSINTSGKDTFSASVGSGDVKYSDVIVDVPGVGSTYVEVKMGHKDNLANPRIYYDGSSWVSNATTPVADAATHLANNSPDAARFINDLKSYMGISPGEVIKIPTTLGGLKDPAAVPLETMRSFVNERGSRYFVNEKNVDVGDLVTQHYLVGKASPAHYIQAGDDFYMIGTQDPLGLNVALRFCEVNSTIPIMAGMGNFKIRVSTRSRFYEIQPELKIASLVPPTSPFSVFGGGLDDSPNKINPFSCLYDFLSSSEQATVTSEARRLIGTFVRESLVLEELTKTDKKEIEKLSRKQAKKEIEASIGQSFVGTPGKIRGFVEDVVRKEVAKILKDKSTKDATADIVKKILKNFYKEVSVKTNTIDRIKI